MPLGLLPGMTYDEVEATVGPGESLLVYSDGFVEAHGPDGSMYGFDRLQAAFAPGLAGSELIDSLLDDLRAFTGRDWEQEDDLTVVNLRRSADPASAAAAFTGGAAEPEEILLDEAIAGELGNERLAMDRVVAAVAPLGLPADRLERLKTAVSETAMNAIEYGSRGQADVPIRVRVSATDSAVRVRVVDAGLGGDVPIGSAEIPDIDAKLAGLQKPRGWGLFLIEQMVDEVAVEATPDGQAVVLTMHRGGQ
jgi:anti-sigma regulatory factor (Ser/Thr protein kinase)